MVMPPFYVIPAQAGIHFYVHPGQTMDSRLRGNDKQQKSLPVRGGNVRNSLHFGDS
jgi:hypothetical protein